MPLIISLVSIDKKGAATPIGEVALIEIRPADRNGNAIPKAKGELSMFEVQFLVEGKTVTATRLDGVNDQKGVLQLGEVAFIAIREALERKSILTEEKPVTLCTLKVQPEGFRFARNCGEPAVVGDRCQDHLNQ